MSVQLPNSFRSGPDDRGHFGIFGGRYVAETLMPLILDLEKAYADAKADPLFQKEMNGYLKDYVGATKTCSLMTETQCTVFEPCVGHCHCGDQGCPGDTIPALPDLQ